jgi:Fe-Mn family superoxide dismutase
MINRRQAIQRTALVAGAVAVAPSVLAQPAPAAATGPFTLAPLPYAADSLEPFIDAQTMTIHHDRHHLAYITNLNKAVAGNAALATKSVEDLVRNLDKVSADIKTAIRNHGGGHYNHDLFWKSLKKNNGAGPKGELARAIDSKFGSFAKFQEEFTKAATTQFGSGWAWLTIDAAKDIRVEQTANQDVPLSAGRTPLLGLDVWEHAYYLKYQNKRADYIAAFYNVINWDFVAERYAKLKG